MRIVLHYFAAAVGYCRHRTAAAVDNTFFLISLFKMRHVIFSLNEYVMLYVMLEGHSQDARENSTEPKNVLGGTDVLGK